MADEDTAKSEPAPNIRLRDRPASWAVVAFVFSLAGFLLLDFEQPDAAFNLYVIGNLVLVGIGSAIVGRRRGARKGAVTGCLMVAAAIVAPVFLLIALLALFMPT